MPDADTIHPDIFAPAIAVLTRAAETATHNGKIQHAEGRLNEAEASAAEAESCLHAIAILSD